MKYVPKSNRKSPCTKRAWQERILDKFEVTEGGCWNWTASVDGRGYGQFSPEHGVTRRAHRMTYELFVGPIPEGLVIDHLCKNTICVNPDHLEAVTQQVNARRGDTGRNTPKRTTCRRGHPWADGHAQYRPNGTRYCKTCQNARQRARYAERKAVA